LAPKGGEEVQGKKEISQGRGTGIRERFKEKTRVVEVRTQKRPGEGEKVCIGEITMFDKGHLTPEIGSSQDAGGRERQRTATKRNLRNVDDAF